MTKPYAPCPRCNSIGAERMSFTWWDGLLGPKLLTHVKCRRCAHAYNGKTGRDNTNGIIIYTVIVGVIVFGFAIFAMALAALTLFVN